MLGQPEGGIVGFSLSNESLVPRWRNGKATIVILRVDISCCNDYICIPTDQTFDTALADRIVPI